MKPETIICRQCDHNVKVTNEIFIKMYDQNPEDARSMYCDMWCPNCREYIKWNIEDINITPPTTEW